MQVKATLSLPRASLLYFKAITASYAAAHFADSPPREADRNLPAPATPVSGSKNPVMTRQAFAMRGAQLFPAATLQDELPPFVGLLLTTAQLQQAAQLKAC